eukprot:GHRQ01031659.1.p3 GENE.GHRQ01031659.1~~GHRQ01031659.1.p3  ORF type:complete len:140 (+),score=30.31 GHRQ01031659.1:690-1109(+)
MQDTPRPCTTCASSANKAGMVLALRLLCLTCTASAMLSTTSTSAAALCRAVARARRRSFLFILMLQSLGCNIKQGNQGRARTAQNRVRRCSAIAHSHEGYLVVGGRSSCCSCRCICSDGLLGVWLQACCLFHTQAFRPG